MRRRSNSAKLAPHQWCAPLSGKGPHGPAGRLACDMLSGTSAADHAVCDPPGGRSLRERLGKSVCSLSPCCPATLLKRSVVCSFKCYGIQKRGEFENQPLKLLEIANHLSA